jgi:acetolactate synthase-1/2/3 large subunit
MVDLGKTAPGKITGGAMLARALRDKGIDRVFSLCGGFINPIYMGCLEYGIEVVGTRSEMEAGFLATATARCTRKPSVCIAEPSGFTNYVSAVAEAYYAGDPVIFVSATSNSNNFDNQGFKEMPQAEVVRCMTKYSIEVNDAQRIGWFLDKAWDIATQHPTGPVQLCIPTNFLFTKQLYAEPAEGARAFDRTRNKIHRPAPNPADVAEVAKLLRAAKKPVVIAGPQVWYGRADRDLAALCDQWNIPVFVPLTHSKAIDQGHRCAVGLIDYHQNHASRMVGAEADVVLMIGGQLDFPVNFGEAPLFNAKSTLITVNATARELSNNALADVRVCSDVGMFVRALMGEPELGKAMAPDWLERLQARRKQHMAEFADVLTGPAPSGAVHPLRLCYEVLMSLREEDICVIDGGDIASWFEMAINAWAAQGRPVKGIFAPGPWEQMGTGPAFATAIQMANPGSRVVLVTGDGSFGLAPGFTPMETAIDRGVPVTVVVANNSQWGMIQNQQKAMWAGKVVATSLRRMEYHTIMAAAGAFSRKAADVAGVRSALEAARGQGLPAFVDVITEAVSSPITQGLVEMRIRTAIE